VLDAVNARRFAPPASRPSGIDAACARRSVGLLRDGRRSEQNEPYVADRLGSCHPRSSRRDHEQRV